jgi:hypothetical protein
LTSYIYIACRLYRYFIYLFSIKFPNVNVTGIAGAPFTPLPLPLAGNTEGPEEDNGESNDDECNDNDDENSNDNDDDGNKDVEEDGNNGDGDGDSFFGDSFFD